MLRREFASGLVSALACIGITKGDKRSRNRIEAVYSGVQDDVGGMTVQYENGEIVTLVFDATKGCLSRRQLTGASVEPHDLPDEIGSDARIVSVNEMPPTLRDGCIKRLRKLGYTVTNNGEIQVRAS